MLANFLASYALRLVPSIPDTGYSTLTGQNTKYSREKLSYEDG